MHWGETERYAEAVLKEEVQSEISQELGEQHDIAIQTIKKETTQEQYFLAPDNWNGRKRNNIIEKYQK